MLAARTSAPVETLYLSASALHESVSAPDAGGCMSWSVQAGVTVAVSPLVLAGVVVVRAPMYSVEEDEDTVELLNNWIKVVQNGQSDSS